MGGNRNRVRLGRGKYEAKRRGLGRDWGRDGSISQEGGWEGFLHLKIRKYC